MGDGLGGQGCEPLYEESLRLGEQDYRVFRCSWGWCVKHAEHAFRSRSLVTAFEQASGRSADEPAVRSLLETIGKALETEHAQKLRTVATVVSLPAESGV
jgi:hypothetical protein